MLYNSMSIIKTLKQDKRIYRCSAKGDPPSVLFNSRNDWNFRFCKWYRYVAEDKLLKISDYIREEVTDLSQNNSIIEKDCLTKCCFRRDIIKYQL
jgi:hypothetical protein